MTGNEQATPMYSEVLKDDPTRPVVRVGNKVRRAVGWWTPAVHRLLNGLESIGFAASPRVLDIDEQGREVLSYIDGESGVAGWAKITPDDGLRRFARLLRDYHDATRKLSIGDDERWALVDGAPKRDEVICHTDFAPWNIVWRNATPIGILDWDFAGPAPPMNDVAYALDYAIPFRDDETCVRSHGFEEAPDRKRRIEIFADAYGLDSTTGLVDAVIERLRLDDHYVRELAARNLEPQATWVRTGQVTESIDRIPWIEQNRHILE
ncbi:MAG: aminoglycoside phosphotransferase family protein [Ilumatobacteraceae bacterium]